MDKSVLVIGIGDVKGIESYNWYDELPNLADFDVIILDTTKILDFWLTAGRLQSQKHRSYLLSDVRDEDFKIRKNFDLIKRKLREILEFPRNIYALYAPTISIESKSEVESDSLKKDGWVDADVVPRIIMRAKARLGVLKTNDWCPVLIQAVLETGKRIEVQNKVYEQYFEDFKEWNYYFAPESIDISYVQSDYESQAMVEPDLGFIATNKSNKPIAIAIHFGFHRWSQFESGWAAKPYKIGGPLVLLPVESPSHVGLHIQRILEIESVCLATLPPSWTNTIEMPGEAKIKSEIGTLKEQIATTESKIQQLRLSLSELERHKGLLYEKGIKLQELVKSTLQELGAVIEPSIVTDEFIINIGGDRVLVEVKGTERGILKRHLGQLHLDLGRHEDETGEQIKGILIGNAWILLPPESRGSNDNPIFHNNVRDDAVKIGISLLSTVELFEAFCKTLSDPGLKEDILNKIINGQGEITF